MRVKIWRSERDGDWFFHVAGDNGEIILSSEGHANRSDVEDLAGRIGKALDAPVDEA